MQLCRPGPSLAHLSCWPPPAVYLVPLQRRVLVSAPSRGRTLHPLRRLASVASPCPISPCARGKTSTEAEARSAVPRDHWGGGVGVVCSQRIAYACYGRPVRLTAGPGRTAPSSTGLKSFTMAPEAPSPGVQQTSSESIELTNPSPDLNDLACKEDPRDASKKKVIDQNEKSNREPNQNSVNTEKDSGFSDTGSDDLSAVEQTDSDDGSTSRSVELEWPSKPPGVTSNAFPSLTPVYILKNVIIQQTMNGHQFLPTQMAWSGPHALDATTGTSRVLIIQQPMAPAASSIWAAIRKPGTGAYQPILKALPRIAPHPVKDGKTESPVPAMLHKSSTGSSKSKRMRLTTLKGAQSNGAKPELTFKDHETKGKPEELVSSADSKSQRLLQQTVMCNDTAVPSATDCKKTATSSVETSSLVAHQSHFKSFPTVKFSEAETLARISRKLVSNLKKQRRFHNTVDILKRSGLLGITLRTKELISRNKSTQRDISELKEHTRLLCEAVKSNDSSVWEKLQEAMNFTSHQTE